MLKRADLLSESSLRQIIAEEQSLHPLVELVDIYKLVYQAVLGPSHIVRNPVEVSQAICNEYNEIRELHYSPQLQDIGNGSGFWRISLSILSPAAQLGNAIFTQKCQVLTELILLSCHAESTSYSIADIWMANQQLLHRTIRASSAEWDEINLVAQREQIPSHSASFTAAYHPHYRLIHHLYINRIQELLENKHNFKEHK
ncbi:MAG: hypothetical protein PHO32_04580 [Candidatus Cloacimonetes bacterium]|nr:hypothetical protein [Candidatus Cloacimonadota bacterium]